MADTPLHYQTITDVAARIRSREISPVELTQALLDRIAALDGELKSYATVMAEPAMAAARAAEAEIAAGRYQRRAARRTHRGQGFVLHHRRGHHGRVAGAARLRA